MVTYPCRGCKREVIASKLYEGLCLACRVAPGDMNKRSHRKWLAFKAEQGRRGMDNGTVSVVDGMMDEIERNGGKKRTWSPEQRAKFRATRAAKAAMGGNGPQAPSDGPVPPALRSRPCIYTPIPDFAVTILEMLERFGADRVEEAFCSTVRMWEAFRALGAVPEGERA